MIATADVLLLYSDPDRLGPVHTPPLCPYRASRLRLSVLAMLLSILLQLSGCVSDEVPDNGALNSYQNKLADLGPQNRQDPEGRGPADPSGLRQADSLGLLRPTPEPAFSFLGALKFATDPNTGGKTISLPIDEAIVRALANSPEIRVVSFDPALAKLEITKEAAEFDPAVFNRLNLERQDNPVNSIYQSGQADARTLEAGVKQRGVTGAEWSLGYVLTRNWDDLFGRTRPTRYEPILAFQLRQPLLRDGWQQVNLAGVNVARLNHQAALLGFRQKAEAISTQVITAYWLLLQARRDFEIQSSLLNKTIVTFNKVQGRKEIDATDVQIRQAEASVKTREAQLLQARKKVVDAQDLLARLIADPEANLLSDVEILPVSKPHSTMEKLNTEDILKRAVQKNPALEQARLALEIASINIKVAENQEMPRLDLVASARTLGMSRGYGQSHDRLYNGDHLSYEIGLSLEYPIGNRQRKAELMRRQIERRRAVASLHDLADQVAVQAKERIRQAETSYLEIQVQEEATRAAQIHLQTLQEVEEVRERLTPEFLLVKLQAQEMLAQAEKAEIRAAVDFNIATAHLAQVTGTVLELFPANNAIEMLSNVNNISRQTNGLGQ